MLALKSDRKGKHKYIELKRKRFLKKRINTHKTHNDSIFFSFSFSFSFLESL